MKDILSDVFYEMCKTLIVVMSTFWLIVAGIRGAIINQGENINYYFICVIVLIYVAKALFKIMWVKYSK